MAVQIRESHTYIKIPTYVDIDHLKKLFQEYDVTNRLPNINTNSETVVITLITYKSLIFVLLLLDY